ncbi:MerR family transcriptional regulator [Thiofilum flexile]|uniref:MerR family transcriptional regulator n=1 Tax=Thiofilum flexile TaxID=125627 RepID=UPI00036C5461|nr:helix-turn-helix domain-containing protein [Thiofilum flexile]
MTSELTIGALSTASGVAIETIRYYEKSGLLAKAKRSLNGYRRYGALDIQRLRFIRRGRDLGFSIEELKTLLQLADHPTQPCAQADALVQNHLTEVKAKIRDLQAIQQVLEQLAECDSHNAEHCRLLEVLDHRSCCSPVDFAWVTVSEA